MFSDKRVTIMGCPYHGLVTNGQLTLPNLAVINCQQPAERNILLSADGLLPDRSGNEFDQANGYQWKDRLLLSSPAEPGVEPPSPPLLPFGQVAFRDDAGFKWLLSVEPYYTSNTWGCTVRLVKRFGLFELIPTDDFDNQFFDSGAFSFQSVIDSSDHLLDEITGTSFIEQSPDGQKILMGVQASASKDFFEPKLAAVYELTVTGVVDEFGQGLSVVVLELHGADDCCKRSSRNYEQDYEFREIKITKENTVTCTPEGASCDVLPGGTGQMQRHSVWTNTAEESPNTNTVGRQVFGIGYNISEYVQRGVVAAYYDEDGLRQSIEMVLKSGSKDEALSVDYFPRDNESTLVVYSFPTDCTHYNRTTDTEILGERVTIHSKQTSFTKNQITINGVVVSELNADYAIDQNYVRYFDDTVTSESDSGTGEVYLSNYHAVYESYLTQSVYSNLTKNGIDGSTSTEGTTVTACGVTIYTSGDQEYSLACKPKIFGNRIAAIDTGTSAENPLADSMGIIGAWCPATDRAALSGKAKAYCTYDPYTVTIVTSDDLVGFV